MKRTLLSIAALAVCFCAAAQYIPDSQDFRVGKLGNGLTYYLYRNNNPSGCADFYITHNVGALQEEDSQNGLAHFLEHMAFNGTKHYPEKGLLEFLADEGVRFGYNVNAYTSRTETVYNISKVPLVRDSFVDSVLLILHDWSCDISCEQKALDDERGVISEEWRLRDEPRYRMMCRQTELVYKGGKHPERTVLGTMEVINGFKREDILDFYHKWYRPDLQAIIVVGDFDVDKMEKKVREQFADIKMPQNPPQKPSSYMPPKFDGPLCGDQTDPSIKYKAVKILYRQPFPSPEVRHTEEYFRDLYSRQIVTSIITDRLKERVREAGCPLNSAVLVTNASEPEFYTSLFTVSPREDNDMEDGFIYPLEEVRRVMLHGFSQQEFEAARLSVAQRYHLDRDINRADLQSSDLVKVCIENFLRNYPLLDPIDLQSVQRKAISEITFESVSEYPAKMFGESEVIYSNCLNKKEICHAVPKERILAIADSISKADLKAQFLEYPQLDLSVNAPAGTVKSRKELKSHGIQLLTLSNGVKVYYKKADEVKSDIHLAMEVLFDTGRKVYPKDQIAACDYAVSLMKRYTGFRGCDRLSQKNYPEISGVSLLLNVADQDAGFSIQSRANKAQTAFKILNLQITDPYLPTDKVITSSALMSLKNLSKKKNPKEIYKEYEEDVYYGGNPWTVRLDSTAVSTVDRKFIESLFHDAFCDIRTMEVHICSDLPQEEIESYLCKYVASLPVGDRVKKNKPHPRIQAFKGRTEIGRTNPPISAPVCDIDYFFSKKMKKDSKTRIEIAILDYIMSARYLDLIREKRGGAYHVDFSTEPYEDPSKPVLSAISFQTRPGLKDILLGDIEEEMGRMIQTGPSAAEMDVAVKYLIKRYNEVKHRIANSVALQLSQTVDFVKNGVDFDYDYESVIRSISAKDIQNLASAISSGDRMISVYVEQ